jgi:hypothetical protein
MRPVSAVMAVKYHAPGSMLQLCSASCHFAVMRFRNHLSATGLHTPLRRLQCTGTREARAHPNAFAALPKRTTTDCEIKSKGLLWDAQVKTLANHVLGRCASLLNSGYHAVNIFRHLNTRPDPHKRHNTRMLSKSAMTAPSIFSCLNSTWETTQTQ